MTRLYALLSIFVVSAFLAALPARADEPPEDPEHAHDPTDVWAIGRGGQLYDNWMVSVLNDEIREAHPAYPAEGKKKGMATWRCKECHGWDYLGRDGDYAVGSHKTGIIGVRRMAGMPPDRIQRVLSDVHPEFTDGLLSHSAQEMLSYFLGNGQIDMDIYIDRDTYEARGDKKEGAKLYQSVCANCHGYDGKDINFASRKFPSYTGTVCTRNPWEALHKIRFGQPGVGMVALTNLPMKDVANILAYCQTLPPK